MKLPSLAELERPPGSYAIDHESGGVRTRLRLPQRAAPGVAGGDRWMLEPPAHPAEEGWFMTYLDLMTLLLVVMIVMLAFSGASGNHSGVADAARAAAMRTWVQVEPSVIPPPDDIAAYPAAPESDFAPLPAQSAVPDQRAPEAAAGATPTDITRPNIEAPATAADAYPQATEGESLAAALPLNELGKDVEVIVNQRSVSFRINSEILFDTGQESLSGSGLAVLRRAAGLLSDAGYDLTVEGHTDSVPVRGNARYPSNWELSSARAGSVVRYLQANGVAKSHLKAVGFADTRPIADNDSVQGRSRNRRVELVVSRPRAAAPVD